jgi:hypothetical protein
MFTHIPFFSWNRKPMSNKASYRKEMLGGFLLGLILVWIPLVQQLHYESAALVALLFGFRATWLAADHPQRSALIRVLASAYCVAIPLFIYTLIAGCFSWHGAALWMLLPFPSIFFAFSLGRLLHHWQLSRARLWAMLILVWIALGVWLIEFYHLPQVRFFNHIWGWFPGPIYDEVIHVSPGLVLFRGITFLWGVLLWYLPELSRDKWAKWIIVGATVLLMSGYLNLVSYGIITPRLELQHELTGHEQHGNVATYADSQDMDPAELKQWDQKLETYWAWLSDTLKVRLDPGRQVEAYLYRHAWQKKALVGAKFTSYVPVWLDQPQLHIAQPDLDAVALHEMVHIASKSFGNNLYGASWNIGLVEGLAVALSQNRSETSTIDQLAAVDSSVTTMAHMKTALSFSGFYTGRASVGYTVMGSFVQWLLRNYPVTQFKSAYATGDLEDAYQSPIDSLIAGWKQHLATVPLDTVDRATAQRMFSVPSLFEQACPHEQTPVEAMWDDYRKARAERDTTTLLAQLNALKQSRPDHPTVWSHWMYWQLAAGQADTVIRAWRKRDLAADSAMPMLQVRAADAYQMAGDTTHGHEVIKRLTEAYPELTQRSGIRLRSNPGYWQEGLQLIYKQRIPKIIETPNAQRPLILEQMALNIALQEQQTPWVLRLVNRYTSDEHPHAFWTFDLALRSADYLALNAYEAKSDSVMEIAQQLIQRSRDEERWEQQQRWIRYYRTSSSVKDF